jgi:hypothetical protein
MRSGENNGNPYFQNRSNVKTADRLVSIAENNQGAVFGIGLSAAPFSRPALKLDAEALDPWLNRNSGPTQKQAGRFSALSGLSQTVL